MEKKKVSPFEFAIAQAAHAADPSKVDITQYETWTREEEQERRRQVIEEKLNNILENSKKK